MNYKIIINFSSFTQDTQICKNSFRHPKKLNSLINQM